MEDHNKISLLIHLSGLEDPRPGENTVHNFLDILFMAVCAVISGCESWIEIEDYALTKKSWFSDLLSFNGKTPSHDTFRRVFCMIDFKEFQRVFSDWTAEVKKTLGIKDDQICIDGKRLCGSFSKGKAVEALHMVNAWSTEASMCLAQQPTDQKSNEITAIPELLSLLDLKGCLVSIDAIGCQKDIASSIVDQDGFYLLAVKRNQEKLSEAIKTLFTRNPSRSRTHKLQRDIFRIEEDNVHGRKEARNCHVLYVDEKTPQFFPKEEWRSVTSLIRVTATRSIKATGETSKEQRYYISNAKKSAKEFNRCVRNHWQVENKCHWLLDVAFNEDSDKKWADESAKNFALLRQLALTLLKKESSKMSIKRKRRMAAMDNDYLIKVLFAGEGFQSHA